MYDFPFELLKDSPIALSEKSLDRLNTYGKLLLEYNEKINLTAITEPREIVIKHFLDCLTFFAACDIPKNAKIIDVGTGAGFPGMVLKIARDDLNITLLDSLNKRLVFLGEVAKQTGVDVEIIHSRAEDGGKNAALRESFDFSVARAVAPLNVLLEYCTPFVKVGGSFIAMKGPAAKDELENAKRAASVLNMSEPKILGITLTGEEQRYLLNYKKISQTPPKYPRMSAKISKMPLN